MKRIIFALCAIVMLCMMTSCESENVRGGRELYRLYLEKTLIVPDEMKIYGESYVEDVGHVEWTVDVGGVTRGGHHFRETMRFRTTGNQMIKILNGEQSGKLLTRGMIVGTY